MLSILGSVLERLSLLLLSLLLLLLATLRLLRGSLLEDATCLFGRVVIPALIFIIGREES